MKHRISLFRGTAASQTAIADSTPELSWDELQTVICQSNWAAGTYHGNHRAIKNFEQLTVLALDIDGGCTLDEARTIFADYEFIIAPTRHHQKEKVMKSGKVLPPCDRFRVLIPLSEPIHSDEDYKATWFQALAICPALDPACKDSSRFFYPSTEILFTNSGDVFPVSYAEKKTPIERAAIQAAGPKLRPSKRTQDFLFDGAPDGQWHSELVAACLDLKQQKWTKEEARLKIQAITGHLDQHDEETIDDVFDNREARHEPRGEFRESERKRILKCHMIANTKDPSDVKMVDLTNGRVHPIHKSMVEILLNKQEYGDYMNSRYVPARFEYNPFIIGPLTNDEDGCYLYNSYIPPKWKNDQFFQGKELQPVGELPEIYEQFFTHLTGGHTESKDYLVDWLAKSLQGRNFTILTAIGEQGIGKGTLGAILKKLHGDSNFSECRDGVFKERFNGKLENKTLVYVDEIDLKTKESQDRMKAVVNEQIEIEKKGENATTVDNYASFYISSNSMDAIKIEAGDRRFSIIQLTDTKLANTPLIDSVAELLSDENVARLGRYLQFKRIDRDMLFPFRSARFEEVKVAGLKEWEVFLLESFIPKNAGGEPLLSAAQEAIEEARILRSAPGRQKFNELQKKYPEMFKMRQRKDGARVLEIPREPKGYVTVD